MTAAAKEARDLRVAVTGIRTTLGEGLVQYLAADDRVSHVLALDVAQPLVGHGKTRYVRLDLTDPRCDEKGAKLLRDDGIDTLVHCAFLAKPSHNPSWAHEVEAIGSLYAMNAAAEAKVRKVVLSSSTMCYGAYADNPNFLTEKHPLRGMKGSRFVRDKVAAERELEKLGRDVPGIITTSLRFASIVGPTARSYMTLLLAKPTVPKLAGYNPLMQFLHEEDALAALHEATINDHPGAYNIAADGVLLHTQVMRLGGKVPLGVPHGLAYPAANLLWNLQLTATPGPFLNYFRFPWVADNSRMKTVMGFEPQYTSRQALESFYETLLDAPPKGVAAASTKGV